MLYEINENDKLHRFDSKWSPLELDVEKYLISSENERILDSGIFGEPLLLIKNQVKTKYQKRADILAIDRFGNGVIIELKRDRGMLGVETQALQYLADFSVYKGANFIKNFCKNDSVLVDYIHSFIDAYAKIEDINKNSRVILVARDFDSTIFSMGEWLSNNNISFRCISYEPIEVASRKLISFNIAFDRSNNSINPIIFSSISRSPAYYWHNIANNDQKWWSWLIHAKQIPACFDSMPGDQGEKILRSYISGDIIIAYATGFGAVGWGEIIDPNTYRIINSGGSDDYWQGDCMHRLDIESKYVAKNLSSGIKPGYIREYFNIYHPISTSVGIDSHNAKRLITHMSNDLEKV